MHSLGLFFFFFSYSFKIFECVLSVRRKKPYVYFPTESGPQNPSQHKILDSLNPFLSVGTLEDMNEKARLRWPGIPTHHVKQGLACRKYLLN